MPKKKPTPKKKPAPVLQVLKDERKRKAALVLAHAGYRRYQKQRTGALTHAARTAEVSREQVYTWLDDPDFVEAIEEVSNQIITECLESLRKAARNLNPTAAIYMLKVQDPARFDDQYVRDLAKQAHEKEMLKLKVEAGVDPLTDQRLPDLVVREAGDGERIEAGPDGGGH